jgi:hypothetical protein
VPVSLVFLLRNLFTSSLSNKLNILLEEVLSLISWMLVVAVASRYL